MRRQADGREEWTKAVQVAHDCGQFQQAQSRILTLRSRVFLSVTCALVLATTSAQAQEPRLSGRPIWTVPDVGDDADRLVPALHPAK